MAQQLTDVQSQVSNPTGDVWSVSVASDAGVGAGVIHVNGGGHSRAEALQQAADEASALLAAVQRVGAEINRLAAEG